jgi:hypothetical protein
MRMLPAFRFMLGAALATLLLVLTVFGLAATVRLAQETKASPVEAARALAYATPAGWGEIYSDEGRRLSEIEHEPTGVALDPLRGDGWPIPAHSAKSAASPQESDKQVAPEKHDTGSSPPAGERLEATPPPAVLARPDTGSTVEIRAPAPAQEPPSLLADLPGSAMATASDQSATAERPLASVEPQTTADSGPEMPALAERPERASDIPAVLPSDQPELVIEPLRPSADAADGSAPTESKPADPVATAKHTEQRAARVSKAAQKPKKTAAHFAKLRKAAPKPNMSAPANPLFMSTSVPAAVSRSNNNQAWPLSGEPLTPLSSQSCGPGSTTCSRVSLGSRPPPRPTLQVSRPAPGGSHP